MLARLKWVLWQWRFVWITTPSITGLVILMRWLCLLQPSELAIFDRYMRLRPTEPLDRRIAIVGIDETDVKECCYADGEKITNLCLTVNSLSAKL